jgi:hypothetical protein
LKKVTYEQWAAAHPDERASHQQFAGHHDADPAAAADQAAPDVSGGGKGPLQVPPGAAGPVPGGTLSPVAYAPPTGRKRTKHDLAVRRVFLVVVAAIAGVGIYFAVVAAIGAIDSRPQTHRDLKDGIEIAIPADWETTPLAKSPTSADINPFPDSTSRVLYTKARKDGKLVALVSEVRPNNPATPMDAAALQQMAAQFSQQRSGHAEATTVDLHDAMHLSVQDTGEGDVDSVVVADGNRALVLVILDRTTYGATTDVDDIIKSFHLIVPNQSGN